MSSTTGEPPALWFDIDRIYRVASTSSWDALDSPESVSVDGAWGSSAWVLPDSVVTNHKRAYMLMDRTRLALFSETVNGAVWRDCCNGLAFLLVAFVRANPGSLIQISTAKGKVPLATVCLPTVGSQDRVDGYTEYGNSPATCELKVAQSKVILPLTEIGNLVGRDGYRGGVRQCVGNVVRFQRDFNVPGIGRSKSSTVTFVRDGDDRKTIESSKIPGIESLPRPAKAGINLVPTVQFQSLFHPSLADGGRVPAAECVARELHVSVYPDGTGFCRYVLGQHSGLTWLTVAPGLRRELMSDEARIVVEA